MTSDLSPGAAEQLIEDWTRAGRQSVPRRPDLRDHEPQNTSRPTLPRVRTLSEILSSPVLMAMPEVVIPRFAYRERTTLFAAREKLGKSTTIAAGIAAASGHGGYFLGDTAGPAEVLLLALEDHVGDVARRLEAFGADPFAVHIIDALDAGVDQLGEIVLRLRPGLIVIDTLPALVERLQLDPGNASAWTPVMARLTRLARSTGAAIVILHHANKSTGGYRDSTAIGAGVDLILEMTEKRDGSPARKITARGRIPCHDFSIRYVAETDPPRFELVGVDLALKARVLAYVEGEPGCSTRGVRNEVRGSAEKIADALSGLEGSGLIENRGGSDRSAWHRVAGSRENPQGTAQEPVRNRSGNRFSDQGARSGSSGGRAPAGGGPGNRAPEPPPLDEDLDRALEERAR